jgi:hypothetical protein
MQDSALQQLLYCQGFSSGEVTCRNLILDSQATQVSECTILTPKGSPNILAIGSIQHIREDYRRLPVSEFGSTAAMSLTNCRFYENKYPDLEEFVMVNVRLPR